MGPVNMMALEEFKETEQRHLFLETQRKDLLDSIENTQATIKEIDEISIRSLTKPSSASTKTSAPPSPDSSAADRPSCALPTKRTPQTAVWDIVAQPPGKKLQNVFLLSGGEKALTCALIAHGHLPVPAKPVLRA